ncbi:MAG: trypsin-like peptidase domain-containing protein [Deltaproteobacteria bacterium]
MTRSRKWSIGLTVAVIFGIGLLLGLWLNRVPAPAGIPAPLRYQPRESGEAVVMQVYQHVNPAVVNIAARRLALTFWMRVIPQTGQGSGFVIDSQGHILTNNHVVANAENLEVTFSGGKKVDAQLIGRDPVSDLAVIKVKPFPEMQVAPLGDSSHLVVGQRVIAIGNPFGFQHTVTSGFISALGRDIAVGQRTLVGMIQTDAAINPGNSGGPLINTKGKVIGVNTVIFTQGGAFTGIGFAEPINRARKVAHQIIDMGRVIYPWMGLKSWMDLDPNLAVKMGLPPVKGVLIFELVPGSPAALAGLRGGTRVAYYRGRPILLGGDVILSVDGVPTPSFDDFHTLILQKNVGDKIKVTYLRGKKESSTTVTLFADPRM